MKTMSILYLYLPDSAPQEVESDEGSEDETPLRHGLSSPPQ